MLCELHLQNLAVAADVSVRLSAGLNVLTGSTGAGKSLVAEAARWLRGETIDRGVLRAGATMASAEAVFDLHARPELVERLAACGVEVADDGILTLRREVPAEGRARAWIDGRLTSAALLQRISTILIQSQAQHVQLGLLDEKEHVHLLDALGVDGGLVRGWAQAREEHEAARRAIEDWRAERERLVEQRDILEYQWRELDGAGLVGDELAALRGRVSMMEGGARLLELADVARARLEDEATGAQAALGQALASLRRAGDGVAEIEDACEELEGALDLANEATRRLQRVLGAGEVDPRAFEEAQERLGLLVELGRKYGRTEAELIRLRDRLREQLDRLEEASDLPAALAAEEERARDRLDAAGRALHAARKRVGRRAAADAAPLLVELGMEGAALEFQFVPEVDAAGPVKIEGRRVAARPGGPAAVTLLARTNPGERPTPVHRGASGGELSRIALVLRSLALRGQAPALLLLDEVDAGIGADLAPAVARRLVALAEAGQLLVITHQPQIAAVADRHLLTRKLAEEDRVASEVTALDRAQKLEEIVRMIGADTPDSRQLASGMLDAEKATG